MRKDEGLPASSMFGKARSSRQAMRAMVWKATIRVEAGCRFTANRARRSAEGMVEEVLVVKGCLRLKDWRVEDEET